MSKLKNEPFPGSEYRGYVATACKPTSWTDRYRTNESIPCYKLTLETPYVPFMSDAVLDEHLKRDLSDVFPDIGIISHKECNRRAFEEEREFIPFGCQKSSIWNGGRVLVELLLFEEFTGFPVDNSGEDEDTADPEDDFSEEAEEIEDEPDFVPDPAYNVVNLGLPEGYI